MPGFEEIVGHEQIVTHLKSAMKLGKVSHAYILSGEKGCGKKLLADVFAETLQCEKGGTEPCGSCHSCVQAQSGNHPDIIHLMHEKPNSISVDDVRTQIVNDVLIKPYSGKYKIYIVPGSRYSGHLFSLCVLLKSLLHNADLRYVRLYRNRSQTDRSQHLL